MFGHNDQNHQQNNNASDNSYGNNQTQIIGGLGTPPGQSENSFTEPMPLLAAEGTPDVPEPITPDPLSMAAPSIPMNSDNGPIGVPPPPSSTPDPTNDLIDLKSKALHQLAPLVDHLDQSPEEKFRTTMMMIQASDNQDLIKDAYEAAQAIPDEKAKAQALLDVVNEINYFTQHSA